jgi:AraC-like DNA-binding protein
MKIPVYRFRVDYLTLYSEINPLLLFAQKYEFAAGEASPLRRCYANTIALIESGEGMVRLNDEDHPVHAGSLVYISAGSVHRWVADVRDPMVHRCVYFDWKYVSRPGIRYQRDYFYPADVVREELVAPLPGLTLQEIATVSNIPLWVSYFNAFTPPPELLSVRNPWDFLKYNGAFQTFLHKYLAFAMKTEMFSDPRIKKILDKIENEPLEQCERNIYQWARELGLGKSRFHDLFRHDTGFTPKEYLQRLKFQQIAADLCYTDLTITEIAQKYGFSSIHYFSKAFRNMMGMTPTQYRNQYR